jgi:hypothetical protein
MLACERKFEEEVGEWEARLKAADAQWAARLAEAEQQAGECDSVMKCDQKSVIGLEISVTGRAAGWWV